MKLKKVLWIPDVIKFSNGIACGDKMIIQAYEEKDQFYFSFYSESCAVASEMADYLENNYSGKTKKEIYLELNKIKNVEDSLDPKIITLLNKRKKCAELPIDLLYEIIENIENTKDDIDKKDKNVILECDACVSTKKVKWTSEDKKSEKKTLKSFYSLLKELDDPNEIELQNLGLCKLSNL